MRTGAGARVQVFGIENSVRFKETTERGVEEGTAEAVGPTGRAASQTRRCGQRLQHLGQLVARSSHRGSYLSPSPSMTCRVIATWNTRIIHIIYLTQRNLKLFSHERRVSLMIQPRKIQKIRISVEIQESQFYVTCF